MAPLHRHLAAKMLREGGFFRFQWQSADVFKLEIESRSWWPVPDECRGSRQFIHSCHSLGAGWVIWGEAQVGADEGERLMEMGTKTGCQNQDAHSGPLMVCC